MKTSRMFRIFMMGLDTIVLFFLRLFRKFTHLETFTPTAQPGDAPHAVEGTQPARLGIETELTVDGQPTEHFERQEPIFFPPDEPYSPLEGIVTFRGNNLRTGGAYGQSAPNAGRLETIWSIETGRLKKGYGTGYWTGSGWTGQPLIVRWSAAARARMQLYPAAQEKSGLTEVIYSTMDGNVYFLDLETGERTRDDLVVGLPFKGAGALDPREENPMLFLGAGDSGEKGCARAYIYSLLNCEKLAEFGADDPFAQRVFHGYDSSALVDKRTDTFLQPGENGIFYTFKMGTTVDAETGKITLHPHEVVRLRYRSNRSSEQAYWLGMEDSAVVWREYMFIADNGGNLFCLNLNTMEVVWTQDVADDTNGSPVFAMEDGMPYLYIATSLHWTASKKLKLGDVPIFKINALTGEYVWRRTYLCNTVAGISGGVQATCVLGQQDIERLVIFPVARTPQVRTGVLVALDRYTGEEVWKRPLPRYAWASPVAVYDENGRSVIVQADTAGTIWLIEGATGRVLDQVNLGSAIEATPAVFNDTIVVGVRGQRIFGVRISGV